tara:strand:- start:867 stop:1118 length:252 start_codon:yes stop_codon:yes gene_type:complete
MIRYEIGRKCGNAFEWEDAQIPKEEIVASMLKTLKFSDTQAERHMELTDKAGTSGIWIDDNHKLRMIEVIEKPIKKRKKRATK